MTFVYRRWEELCRALSVAGLHSIPAREVARDSAPYLVLKHDVETKVASAYRMAEIEARHGHRGSYYVQAYLLHDKGNLALLQKIREMGHEVSYHYDVMDACHGDLSAAIAEFEANRQRFEANGFSPVTVCQHGNPIVERVGYTSNRDFFRSERVRTLYPGISDIMVNFGEARGTSYAYYSDAGRRFKRIYDPLTNDLTDSSDKDIPYDTLTALLGAVTAGGSHIVSVHPHRWTASALVSRGRAAAFRVIRAVARCLAHIPFVRRWMAKHYDLAKKL